MNCGEIENRLPAYLEDLLSPGEKKTIEGHLASCSRCCRAASDLKKAEKLVQDLTEVEPPPFFEQRIMSRVREEAGRKQGIFRRLFDPLHIKITVPALATILVAVLAYHVYQQGDPEMKRLALLPVPQTEQAKGRTTAESSGIQASPPTVTPSERPPAGNLPEAVPQPFVASPSEKRDAGQRSADSETPTREEAPAAAKSATPAIATKEKDSPASREEGLGKAEDRGGREKAARVLEMFSAEPKQEKAADAGAASGDVRKSAAAPAPSRLKAAAIHPSAIDLTIQVRNPAAALRELESSVTRVNARIVERQSRAEGEFWKVEIASQSLVAFLNQLDAVGRVSPKTDASAAPAGIVTLGITVVALP